MFVSANSAVNAAMCVPDWPSEARAGGLGSEDGMMVGGDQ